MPLLRSWEASFGLVKPQEYANFTHAGSRTYEQDAYAEKLLCI